jgi:phospholipase/carboxylesterase
VKIETLELAGLTTRIVGNGPVTAVLCHGFGAPGDDLVALAQFINAPNVRFVFPAAPIELGGLYGDSRAWWHLDLQMLESDLRTGAIRDRRNEVPEGLDTARAKLDGVIDELKARYAIDETKLVLGGFSQGAMISLDVALHRDVAPAGLVLMSGTLLAESVWEARFARLSGVPVVMSHGKADALLPFAISQHLRDRLIAAGATVDWIEFMGGHEIPPPVLDGVSRLLRKVV